MPTPGPPARVAVVVLAAGSGTRVGADVNKVLLPLAGVPVVARSVGTARAVPGAVRVVLVVREDEQDACRDAVEAELDQSGPEVVMVIGGQTRHQSEWSAMRVLEPLVEAGELDLVAIHDAARPLAGVELYQRVLAAAGRIGGAIPVAPLDDLVDDDGSASGNVLAGVQTPQAFRARDLLAAHRAAAADGFEATDTAGILTAYTDLAVAAVESTAANLKLTVADDFAIGEALIAR